METNFALFENILFQAKYDSSTSVDMLYNIGLSGMYQSPLYYVMYHMIKLIDKHMGHEEIISLFSETPEKIFLKYVALYDQHRDTDGEFIALSHSTMNLSGINCG